MKTIEYPAGLLPLIDRAGEFPLVNPVYDFAYRSPTHALHLYGYAGTVWIGRDRFDFAAGDATVTPAGQISRYTSDRPGKHRAIHFAYPRPGKRAERYRLPCHVLLGGDHLFVLEQVRMIARLFNAPPGAAGGAGGRREASARLHALLLSLANLPAGGRNRRRPKGGFRREDLFELIEDRLAGPVATADLAAALNVSPHTLAARFKREFGCTVARYVLGKRIDRARSLLAATPLTVGEVGVSVGIPDPQYFNKQFRRVAGISPSRYREESREYLAAPDLAAKDGYWAGNGPAGD